MAETRLPVDFSSGQKSSFDALGGAIPRSFNVLVDGTGTIHLRPGISAWGDFGPSPSLDATTSVDGISVWDGYPIYVTSDRKLHAQLSPGLGIDLSSATATTQLDGSGRPVLCPTRARIVIAGGGALQKWEGIGGLSARLGGNPPAATHVTAIQTFLVVNPIGQSGLLQWSGPGDVDNELWTGILAGSIELESDPDPCVAVYVNTGELIGFGPKTVQTLDPDPSYIASNPTAGTSAFLPVRTWTQGMAGPYSFAQNDERFGFVDALSRIQLSDGRQYEPISEPALTATLEGVTPLADCWGFRMKIGSWDLLGWNFPTAGRTFVYDTGAKIWSEWGGFANGAGSPWMAKSHYFWPEPGPKVHLIGLGDGTIAKMDTTVASDMGQPIVGEVVSGFQDFGTDLTKVNVSLRLYFRRGLGAWNTARPPRVQVFWRNDTGAWQGPIERDLGTPGDQTPVVEIRGMGAYKMRQFRVRMSDSVPLSFVRAIETFETGEM